MVRAIDSQGKNLGDIPLEEALYLAKSQELDVIEIAPTANPPVVKIADFGRFKYEIEKKERERHGKQKETEVKMLRIGFKTGRHDLELRASQATEFIQKGNKVRIDMMLRGREKALRDFAKRRFQEFLALIPGHALDQDVKSTPQGFTVILKKA